MSGIVKNSRMFQSFNYDNSNTKMELMIASQTSPAEMFIVANKLSVTLYVSQFPNVSSTNYELAIISMTQNVLTVPQGANSIYVYASATGMIDVQSFQCDELFPSDIQKVLNTGVVSSVSSAITAIDGGIVSIGAKSDTYTTDETQVKSLLSVSKGVLKLIKDLTNIFNGVNDIGDVKLLAGTEVIGKVDINSDLTQNKRASVVVIYNLTLTTTPTIYNQVLPANLKSLDISIQDGNSSETLVFNFSGLTVAFMKIYGNQGYSFENICVGSALTISFASNTSGVVVQMVATYD
jgi:hypothetical protein